MKYADSVKGELAFKLNDLTNMFGDYISEKIIYSYDTIKGIL